MADSSILPPASPQPIQVALPTWLVVVMRFLLTQLAPILLGSASAGAAAGWMVNAKIDSVIQQAPETIRKRLLPPPLKAEEAIGLLDMGRSRCTATIIGPVYSDDPTVDVLSAGHCIALGQTCKFTLKDGRILTLKCVAHEAASDCAWLQGVKPVGDVPYLLLADELPAKGSGVWHQGYGVDRPNNRELGTFTGVASGGKQCQFRLSVSPGDSGGAIVLNDSGRVMSPVCCTTRLAGTGDVWGASPLRAAELRPSRNPKPASRDLIHPILYLPAS